MEALKNITNKFDGYLSLFAERFNNRFIFSFIVSWLTWNWDIFYYFTQANNEVTSKILWITNAHGKGDFFYPLLLAAIYSTLFPLIRNILDSIWTASDKVTKWLLYRFVDKKIFLTTEDRTRLVERMQLQEIEHRKAIEALEKTVSSYRQLVTNEDMAASTIEDDLHVSDGASNQGEMSEFTETISSDNLKKLFKSENGIYKIKNLIATEIFLDRDDANHKKEIEIDFTVLHEMAKVFPTPWQIIDLNTPHGTQNRVIVRSIVRRLEKVGLVKQDETREKFQLSNKSISKLTLIATGGD